MKIVNRTLICLLFGAFTLLTQQVNAQVVYPLPSVPNSQWTYRIADYGTFPPLFWETPLKLKNDTLINGVSYHSLFSAGYRTDNQKVYVYRYNQSEPSEKVVGGDILNGEIPFEQDSLVIDFNDITAVNDTLQHGYLKNSVVIEIDSTYILFDGNLHIKYTFENIASSLYFSWIDGVGVSQGSEHANFESPYSLVGHFDQNGYLINTYNVPYHADNSAACTASITATSSSLNHWTLSLGANTSLGQNVTWALPNANYSPPNNPYGDLIQNQNSINITLPYITHYQGQTSYLNQISVQLYVWDYSAHCIARATVQVSTNSACRAILVPIAQAGQDSIILRNLSTGLTPQTSVSVTGSPVGQPTYNLIDSLAGSTTDYLFSMGRLFQVGQFAYDGGAWLRLSGANCTDNVNYREGSKICDDGFCVYPGDTNGDNIVNQLDFLPIIAMNGTTTPGRFYTDTNHNIHEYIGTINWTGQRAQPTANHTQIANYDCDGNGTIDRNDTVAINRNYNKQHLRGFPLHREAQNTSQTQTLMGAPMSVVFRTDSLDIIQYPATIAADIYLGTPTQPANRFLGTGFRIQYDSNIADSAYIVYDNTSWLGNSPIIETFEHKNSLTGQIDAAFARNNHTNASGAGKIATCYFVLNDNIINNLAYSAGNIAFPVQVTTANGIDSLVASKPISTTGSRIILKNMLVDTKQESIISTTFFTNNNTIFTTNAPVNAVLTLYDILGHTILHQVVSPQVDITNLPKGVYFCSIFGANNRLLQTLKLVKIE